MDIQEMFDKIVIRPGEQFAGMRTGVESLGLANMRNMFEHADLLVQAFYRHGYRIKVISRELNIRSSRRPDSISFYARPRHRGSTISFNFHPVKDDRLSHIRLSGKETRILDQYYCFERTSPAEIEAFLKLVREAETEWAPGR